MAGGTRHPDAVGDELHISRVAVGTGTPNGTVTAGIIGELFWDTTNNLLYVAEAVDNASWIRSTSESDAFLELSDVLESSYTGKALQIPRVNAGETGLEFSNAGSGDVTAPPSSTAKALVRYKDTTGNIIEDSPLTTLDDNSLLEHGGSIVQKDEIAPTIVGTLGLPMDSVEGIAVFGSFAYTLSAVGTLFQVVNISNPAAPVVVGSISDSAFTAGSSAVQGRHAYVTSFSSDRLTIIDISNPSAPVILGFIADATDLNGAWDLAVAGEYAYVTAQIANKLTVVDISNPALPFIVGSITSTDLDGVRGISISGRYAYVAVATANRFSIIDIDDPLNMTIVGSLVDNLNLDGAYDTAAVGGFAYVAAPLDKRLTILNVTDPTAPVVVGSVQDNVLLNGIERVTVYGRYAYVISKLANTFAIIDISDPVTPVIVGSVTDSIDLNSPFVLAVAQGHAFIGSGLGGDDFTVVKIGSAEFPNIKAGEITVDRLDVLGDVTVEGSIAVETGISAARSIVTQENLVADKLVVGGPDIFPNASVALEAIDRYLLLNYLTDTQVDALLPLDQGALLYNRTREAVRAAVGVTPSPKWVYASNITEVLFIRSLEDFPDPTGFDIIIPDNTAIFIETTIELGNLTLVLGEDCSIAGYSTAQSILTSTDVGETLNLTAVTGRSFLANVTIGNTAATPGNAISLSGGSALLMDRVDITGDIVIGTFNILSVFGTRLTGGYRFTTDNPGGLVNISESLLLVGANSDGLVVEEGVNLRVINIDQSAVILTTPTSRGIVLSDPDAIGTGRLDGMSTGGGGTELLVVDPGLGTGLGIGFEPFGMTVFEGNLYTVDNALDRINKHVGLTSTIDSFIASNTLNPRDIVFVQGNLVTCSASSVQVDIHVGFTTTISSSFTPPAGAPSGITFDGVNLIVLTDFPGDIYVMDGISGTVLQTLDAVDFNSGLHFDGTNLWVGKGNTIEIRQGISNIIQYTLTVSDITGEASGSVVGMAQTTSGGPMILADIVADDVFITAHSVVFDQSSPTWQINESGSILDSADAGCSSVRIPSGASVTINTVDEWVDLSDGGVNIIHALIGSNEKFILSDDNTGEMTYTGILSKAFTTSCILLADTSAGTDTIEIGISINGLDPSIGAACSMASGIVTTTQAATLTSPSSSIRLVPGDKIKLQVRNKTDTSNLDVFQVLLAVTG